EGDAVQLGDENFGFGERPTAPLRTVSDPELGSRSFKAGLAFSQPTLAVVAACASAPGVSVPQLHTDRSVGGENPAQLGGDSQQRVDVLGRVRLVADLLRLV